MKAKKIYSSPSMVRQPFAAVSILCASTPVPSSRIGGGTLTGGDSGANPTTAF